MIQQMNSIERRRKRPDRRGKGPSVTNERRDGSPCNPAELTQGIEITMHRRLGDVGHSILRVVGENRPGIQYMIATYVAKYKANIRSLRLSAFLGQEVIAMFLLEGTNGALTDVELNLEDLESSLDGLWVDAKRADGHYSPHGDGPDRLRFSMRGRDYTGLLSDVSSAFTNHGYDILDDSGDQELLPSPCQGLEFVNKIEVLPTSTADYKGLIGALETLYQTKGVFWTREA